MYAIVIENDNELLNIAKERGHKIIFFAENDVPQKHENVINKENVNINDFLLSIGIKPHIKGFRYLKYILENNIDCEESVTTYLYPKIAKTFNTTASRVERAIRHAIKSADYKHEHEMIFGTFKESPTNSQFLRGVKNYYKKS